MQTIPLLCLDPITESTKNPKAHIETIKFLNKIKNSNEEDLYNLIADSSNITTLQNIAGNSLTAASKLLHFTHPKELPIWDSKICKELTTTTQYRNIQLYQKYISDFRQFRKTYEGKDFTIEAQNCVNDILGYDITLARLVELTIFTNATQKPKERRAEGES